MLSELTELNERIDAEVVNALALLEEIKREYPNRIR